MDTVTEVPWRIELLGGLRARRDDRLVTHFRTQKTGYLLAYLAYNLRAIHQREQLIELLWPECEPAAGRHRLSVALSSLRRELDPGGCRQAPVLIADRLTVTLDAEVVTTDVAEFEQTLAAIRGGTHTLEIEHALNRARALYQGPLLPGCYLDWSLLEQERLEEAFFHTLLHTIALLETAGNLTGAIRCGSEAVRIAPLREEAHRELIRLLILAHEPAEASRQYQRLERLLREEIDAAPSPATLALVRPLPTLPAPADRRPARPADGRRRPRGAAPGSADRPRALPTLPLPLTRFFGHEAEIDRLVAMLVPAGAAGREGREDAADGASELAGAGPASPTARLVTITGLPGSGKTRLALEVAGRLGARYDNALLFVPLENVTDATTLLDRLQRASGQQRSARVDLFDGVVAALAAKPHLLVLDGFENLVDAGTELIRKLLEDAPLLKCLATSRRPLKLAGEQIRTIAPLPTPARGDSLDVLRSCPSVQLYVDRARASQPGLMLTPENAAEIAEMCRSLEGLPLALELVARWPIWLALTTPIARVVRLRTVAATDRRGRDGRAWTLDAALDASYQLLTPAAQRLAEHLSVFRGGWTIDAAQAIARARSVEPTVPAPARNAGSGNAPPPLEEFGSAFAELTDLSLIAPVETESGLRYRMLDTVRAFAGDRLQVHGEAAAARARHAGFFVALAERACPELTGPAAGVWQHRLERELDNLNAALEWLLTTGQASPAFGLCQVLFRFWYDFGYWTGAREWYARLLELPTLAAASRAEALLCAAAHARQLGDFPQAETWLTECCDLFRGNGNRVRLASAIRALGAVSFQRGDMDRARALYTESLVLRTELQDRRGVAQSLAGLGAIASEQGERAEAGRRFQESLRIYEELGDAVGVLSQIRNLGDVELAEGRYLAARALYERALAASDAAAADQARSALLGRLGQLSLRLGNGAAALAYTEERLQLCRRLRNPAQIILARAERAEMEVRVGEEERARTLIGLWCAECRGLRDQQPVAACLDYLAWPAIETSGGLEAERTAVLFGAANMIRGTSTAAALAEGSERSRRLHALREAMGEAAFTRALAAGQALTLDQVAEVILTPPPRPPEPRAERAAAPHGLRAPRARRAAPAPSESPAITPSVIAAIRDVFAGFHAAFAPQFGRRDRQERSREYLRALLTGARPRPGSAPLSRAVGAPARSLQRFLVEAPWEATAVIRQLQQLLAPMLTHPAAVWRIVEIGCPRRAPRTVGVARQFCPSLGKVTECQVALFLRYDSPAGRAFADGCLHLPPEWIGDGERCRSAAVPDAERSLRTKADRALAMLQRAERAGILTARQVLAGPEYREDARFRKGILAAGYSLAAPETEPVAGDQLFPISPASQVRGWPGWHRSLAMALLAAAFPLVLSQDPRLRAVLPTSPIDLHPLIAAALTYRA